MRVTTRYGFDLVVDPRRNKGVDASVYYNGTYEAGTVFTIMQSLRPGDVFIDAGANIGLMSLAAAQVVGPAGRVHAFEPVPELINLFRQNIALNGTPNVTLHPQALGSANERRTIYERPGINERQRFARQAGLRSQCLPRDSGRHPRQLRRREWNTVGSNDQGRR